mgnify:CR=1 FL=1
MDNKIPAFQIVMNPRIILSEIKPPRYRIIDSSKIEVEHKTEVTKVLSTDRVFEIEF